MEPRGDDPTWCRPHVVEDSICVPCRIQCVSSRLDLRENGTMWSTPYGIRMVPSPGRSQSVWDPDGAIPMTVPIRMGPGWCHPQDGPNPYQTRMVPSPERSQSVRDPDGAIPMTVPVRIRPGWCHPHHGPNLYGTRMVPSP
jgi:hypothetical protein